MEEQDARKLHSVLKRGDLTAAKEILANYPDVKQLFRVTSLPCDVANAMPEDEFCRWSRTNFSGSAMPSVKIQMGGAAFLSGGLCFQTG